MSAAAFALGAPHGYFTATFQGLVGPPQALDRKRKPESHLADIFHEVDEEVRRERLKKLWDRYGVLLIAAVVLFIAAVAGWRFYQHREAGKAAEAGAAFEQAITLADEGKHEESQAALGKIASTGTPSYRALARLRAAAELSQRDPKAAVAEYDKIAADAGVEKKLQELAGIRAAFLMVDTAPLDEMVRRLEPMSSGKATFRHSARELLALGAWRNGDMATSRRWSELIMADAESPANLRARVERLLALTAPAGKG